MGRLTTKKTTRSSKKEKLRSAWTTSKIAVGVFGLVTKKATKRSRRRGRSGVKHGRATVSKSRNVLPLQPPPQLPHRTQRRLRHRNCSQGLLVLRNCSSG